jgi:uncharacterized protein YcfL
MKLIPVLAALAGFAFTAGCATNVNSVSRADSQATPTLVNDKRVITDASLAGLVRIVSVNESVVSGNLKKIQVTLENAKNDTRTISYKFEWTDQDGMATNSIVQSWQSLSFSGRETLTVSSTAISPKAVDFTLKLKEVSQAY